MGRGWALALVILGFALCFAMAARGEPHRPHHHAHIVRIRDKAPEGMHEWHPWEWRWTWPALSDNRLMRV